MKNLDKHRPGESPRLTLRLPETFSDHLDEMAEELGQTPSKIARDALVRRIKWWLRKKEQ